MPSVSRPRTSALAGPGRRRVLALPVRESDAGLVSMLKAGRIDARAALFDRHSEDIERILYRIMGPDSEIADLLQDVFVVALGSIDQLRDPSALSSWLRGIAVHKARKCIAKRQRWRFVQLFAPADLPEREANLPSVEVSEALRCSYALLERLPVDERVAFALRFVDGMELTQVAEACGVSLATVKRRLARAQRAFMQLASQHAVLCEWVEGGEP